MKTAVAQATRLKDRNAQATFKTASRRPKLDPINTLSLHRTQPFSALKCQGGQGLLFSTNTRRLAKGAHAAAASWAALVAPSELRNSASRKVVDLWKALLSILTQSVAD
eukprot:2125670-Alexandrium_andersonii.AAC.1